LIDPRDDPQFTYENIPRYDGPGRAREYDPDCCTAPECKQRDYNRACLLTLERLSQSFAALHLLAWSSAQLWTCDEEGHTVNCPNPQCRFGADMTEALRLVRIRFSWAVRELFKTLTVPAANLTAQWQGFFDTEQAGIGLAEVCDRLEAGDLEYEVARRIVRGYLDVWRQEIVGYDRLEYARWFEPPEVGHGPPS
jgi:hypothetical protein